MGVIRMGGLVCLVALTASCSGTSTAEDARRAELLDRDPLLTTELTGVRWETSAVAGPGSGPGPGPGTSWTDAFRWGTLEGDPRHVVFEASKTARRLGWTITRANCWSGGYHVGGWKQFDRFVAYFSIGWWDYTDQFSVTAETPPVNGGSPTNSPPARSELDPARTCLATAT